ncbi:MAG: T9SS type A sorting domain-containing protein [Candidatus Marinimicrobia bacterium]|nr:T9SS type A sorting domain-containing protein [Candidatus Neomarinimicrobiota bacterium]
MKRTVIMCTVLGLFLAWPVHAQNLVVNSSLEDQMPAFWTPLNGVFGTDVFLTTDTAQTKFSSFKITKAATATEVGWLYDKSANLYWNDKVAGTFNVSAWVKTDGVNTGPADDDAKIGAVYTFEDAAGTVLGTTTLWADQTAASTSWTELTGMVILTADPKQLVVKLIMGKDATGTAYFDNIGADAGPFNGDAETVTGWGKWYSSSAGGNTRVTDTEAHTGDYAVEMFLPDTSTASTELVYYTWPSAVEAGEWYQVGVWIKTVGVIDSADYEATYIRKQNIHERVNLCYFFHTDTDLEAGWSLEGGDKFVYIDQTVESKGWTHYVVAEQAPANATGISLRARFNPKTTGTAYFDDFSVVKMVLAPPMAIHEKDGIAQYPTEYGLSQNYPNPFNPETSIRFSCPKTGWARLDIYNILGQRVTTLVDGIYQAGTHSVSWKAVDNRGLPVASGVYIYSLVTNDTRITRKMLLIR